MQMSRWLLPQTRKLQRCFTARVRLRRGGLGPFGPFVLSTCNSLDSMNRWTATGDLRSRRESDFIKSLMAANPRAAFDERHQSRRVDLMAALICLFNGVVEGKVVATRCGTKR